MRLTSSYAFYRDYWGYAKRSTTSQGVAFARAIQDFSRVAQAAMTVHSFGPFDTYEDEEYARALTMGFLSNLKKLSTEHFADPFESLTYVDTEVLVPRHLLGRRELVIPIPYLRGDGPNCAIFLTFGGTERIAQEMNVLFGLVQSFGVRNGPSPTQMSNLVYWDVRDCTSASHDARDVEPVDRDSLINSAVRLSA